MTKVFNREKLDLIGWESRTPGNMGTVITFSYLSEVDNILSDVEDSLRKTPLGGCGFSSQMSQLEACLQNYQNLLDFVAYLPYDIEELVDHPFHLQVNNEALEYLATIDAQRLTTDNTIGLMGTYTVNSGYGGYSNATALNSVCLGDFIGYSVMEQGVYGEKTIHSQKVESFSTLFKRQYDAIAAANPGRTLEEFLGEILPEEFSVDKDVPLWKELAQTVLDLTIIIPLIEASQGTEWITQDHLTGRESTGKVVEAIIQTIAVVITAGGALGVTGGQSGAKAVGKALAAMFISDLAAGSTFAVGNKMDLPPVLTALLALAAGIGAGKLSSDALFGGAEKITAKQMEQYTDDIARVAEKNGMTTWELLDLLRKDPSKLNLAEAGLVDDVFRRLDKVNYGILEGGVDVATDLTRAQSRNVTKLNNIVENNLTDGDFSGTLADLKGTPIPKEGGGYWDHLTEMKQSYTGLQDVKSGLEGSLKNPNLAPDIKNILQQNLDSTNSWINKIEELFKPFGGIK